MFPDGQLTMVTFQAMADAKHEEEHADHFLIHKESMLSVAVVKVD